MYRYGYTVCGALSDEAKDLVSGLVWSMMATSYQFCKATSIHAPFLILGAGPPGQSSDRQEMVVHHFRHFTAQYQLAGRPTFAVRDIGYYEDADEFHLYARVYGVLVSEMHRTLRTIYSNPCDPDIGPHILLGSVDKTADIVGVQRDLNTSLRRMMSLTGPFFDVTSIQALKPTVSKPYQLWTPTPSPRADPPRVALGRKLQCPRT